MTGALQVLLGDDTLEGLAGAWARAKAAQREASGRLAAASRMSRAWWSGISSRLLSPRPGVCTSKIRSGTL